MRSFARLVAITALLRAREDVVVPTGLTMTSYWGIAMTAMLLHAAAARGARCHMGALGAAPDSSAMTRAARHVFLCAPTIVDTHAHLPHDCSKGTITPAEASNIPLQRS